MAHIAFEARYTLGNFQPIRMMCHLLDPTGYYKRNGMAANPSPELAAKLDEALEVFAEKIVNLERIRQDPALLKTLPEFKGTDAASVELRAKYLKYLKTDESMFRPGILDILKKLLDITHEADARIQNLVLYSNYDDPGLLFVIERALSILLEEPDVFCTAADWGHPLRDGVNYGDFRVVGAARKSVEVLKDLLYNECYVGDTIEEIQDKDLYFFDGGRPSRELIQAIGPDNYFKVNTYTRMPIYDTLKDCFVFTLNETGLLFVPGYAEYVNPYLRVLLGVYKTVPSSKDIPNLIRRLIVAEREKYNIERRAQLRYPFENDTRQILDKIDSIWFPKQLRIRIPGGQRNGGRARNRVAQARVAAKGLQYNQQGPVTPPELMIAAGYKFDRATGTWIKPVEKAKENGGVEVLTSNTPPGVPPAAKKGPQTPPGLPPAAKKGPQTPPGLPPQPANVMAFPSNTNAKPPTAAVPKPRGAYPPRAPGTRRRKQYRRYTRRRR